MYWRHVRAAGGGAAAAVFAAGQASAQALGGAADDDISLWRVGIALLLCIVIAIVAAFVLKARMGGGEFFPFLLKPQRRLRLVEALKLGPHASLQIVACDGQEMLVLTSGQTACRIRDLSAQAESEHAGQPK
jgi:flagellar biogenesis protein FliO